jgi:hypothetical protein
MITYGALRMAHTSSGRRWLAQVSLDENCLRRYASHAAILLIVMLSAFVAR